MLFARNSLCAEADEQLEAVAQQDVSSAELFRKPGLAYSQQNRYGTAKANYVKAIDLNLDNRSLGPDNRNRP